jgi:Zn-dependent protease with chaperone function
VIAFKAHYFDGLSSRRHEVEVRPAGPDGIRIVGEAVDRELGRAELRLLPRIARIARVIELADGARLMVSHDDRLDRWFPHESRMQRLVDRLERHAHAIAVSIVVCLLMGAFTFIWGVPWMADRIAAQIPQSVETRLGEEVLDQLDRYFEFAPSALERNRQDALGARFGTLVEGMPDATHYRLEFRSAPGIGANALALPGGTIVVTDELVEILEDDREFDAVVAHELGHQQHRHALRQTLRSSFVLVIAALFTGDVSSASAVVIAVPTFLLQSHYSRQFEEAADRFAFETLAARRTSPAWFAAAMRKLDAYYDADSQQKSGSAYLSSHPSSADRIAAAEDAGTDFLAEHPELGAETPDYDACLEEGICAEEAVGGVACMEGECVENAEVEAFIKAWECYQEGACEEPPEVPEGLDPDQWYPPDHDD